MPLSVVVFLMKGFWLELKTQVVYTTTKSLSSCLIKLGVLAFTLFISILCAFVPQSNGEVLISSFYITTFLQSVNTMYDVMSFLVSNESSTDKTLKKIIAFVFVSQIVLAAVSVLYNFTLIAFLENIVVVLITIFLVAAPVFLLIYELYMHISNK